MSDLQIEFTHVPTQKKVEFTAFLENFSDGYDAEWSSEKVFGRMDPIVQFKGTTRKINCSFTIPSDSTEEAYINHVKITRLLNMMYPTYTNETTLKIYQIASPPLIMVKFNNLIKSQDSNRGLLGYIPSLKYEPDMNSPIFVIDNVTTSAEKINARSKPNFIAQADLPAPDNALLAFQSLKMSFELNVLHTHKLGYNNTGSTDVKTFPYGFDITKGD